MTDFATGLKKLLVERQMTVYELSKRSGVADQTIHNILHQQSKSPTLAIVRKLAKGLGLKTWQLVRRTVSDYDH